MRSKLGRSDRVQEDAHVGGALRSERLLDPRTGETQTREYTELNPRQKIPLLQDGDFKIAESPAIAAYLSDTYGTRENALIPTEPREYATWLEWCFYAATELDGRALTLCAATAR
jgi:glutathione S-transferase